MSLKTLQHFLEESPDTNAEVDSLDGVVNRLNDELNVLENGIRNLKIAPQQSFETLAIMINKSRLYVGGMQSLALAGLEDVLWEKS